MPRYDAPIRDMRFILQEVLQIQNYSNLPGFEEVTPDLVSAILEEGGKIGQVATTLIPPASGPPKRG